MHFDDADIQIVGYDSNDLDLFSKMQLDEIATKFNESMRYKNIIKRQQTFEQKVKSENEILRQRINKAIDKLYSWGEALDPDFQKEMLDILKEVKDDGK